MHIEGEKTQVFAITHASFMLQFFDISQIAVIRKPQHKTEFIKPGNFPVIIDMLKDLGSHEVEYLHWSEQLELMA